MSREKRDFSTMMADYPLDVATLIAENTENNAMRSKLALSTPNFFGCRKAQTKRILIKLTEFGAAGKFDQVFQLAAIRPDLTKQVLFTLAGSGEQDKMQILLKQDPKLLLTSAPLTDISGAYFESITVFQHAIWAGDVKFMANMMLDCLPEDKIGEAIRIELWEQCQRLMTEGISYTRQGVKYKDSQFTLEPLINALAAYKERYHNWDDAKRKDHWCRIIGGEQARLPAHLRHHYCGSHMLFYSKPHFFDKNLNRTLGFHHWESNEYQLWSAALPNLGLNFAICRTGLLPPLGIECVGLANAQGDFAVLSTLWQKRTQIDLPALILRLEQPIYNAEENPNSKHLKLNTLAT